MTHSVELEINGFVLEGQTQFDATGPRIKTTPAIDMEVEQVRRIVELLELCAKLTEDYGEIKKIEILKIP